MFIVTSSAAGRLDVYVQGDQQAVFYKKRDGVSWSGWERLGGVVVGNPYATSWGGNFARQDVFVVSTDRNVYHKAGFFTHDRVWTWLPSQQDWELLGGQLGSTTVTAVSWGEIGRLDVFATGQNGDILHRYVDGDSGWQPQPDWESLGGTFYADPAVVSWGPNRLDIFATGTDDHVYHKAWTGSAWDPEDHWEPLGGTVSAASPHTAAVTRGGGLLDVFHIGTNQKAHWKSWQGTSWWPSQNDWHRIDADDDLTVEGARLAAVSVFNVRMDLFAMSGTLESNDNYATVLHKAWNGAAWPSIGK